MSFRVDTYIPPMLLRVGINTARSKGQGQQCINTTAHATRVVHVLCVITSLNRFLKRNTIPHFHPANRLKPSELCVSYASCMSLFGIVLHAVHVMFTCYARAVHVLCARTGLNRFKLVQTETRPKGAIKRRTLVILTM